MKLLLTASILAILGLAVERHQSIRTDFHEDANGDYRLTIYGGRQFVCEEKPITVIQQPDAVQPIILECSHR